MVPQYPKWQHSHDGRSVVVHSATEQLALGPGWADNPEQARPPDPEPEPAVEKTRKRRGP